MSTPDTDCQFVVVFGLTVRALREQRGWSQEALAEQADLNRSYVGELERGKAIPSLITLRKLANSFNLSLTNLMAHTERRMQTALVQGIELTAIAC
jgi:transcriptional regulator with XRE-family HTH domain